MSLPPGEDTTRPDSPTHRATDVPSHVMAFLGYFVLALLVTFPLIINFTTQVPGDLLADRNQNLWNLWWIGEALSTPTNPFHTDMLYHPTGVDLYYHSLGLSHGLLGLIPYLLWGLPAGYNTIVLAAFTLSGYGAYRLCKLFTHNGLASFLGGVVFAFTPYMLDALKGQTEVLSAQWIPFYAEAWIRAHREGKARYRVLAGALFAVTAYGSLYYAVYLLIFTLLHTLYSTFVAADRASALRNTLKQGALAATIAFVLMLPLVVGLTVDYKNPRFEVAAGEEHTLRHSADLVSLFSLPADHPLRHALFGPPSQTGGEPLRDYVTLGYAALGLALLGGVVAWRQKENRFWLLLGGIALVLALGPRLQIGDTITSIPMPFKLLEDLPGFDAIGKVLRFTVLARLSMGVLSALGVAWAMSRFVSSISPTMRGANTVRVMSFAVLLALLLVELPLYPRQMQPLIIPQSYSKLAEQQGDKALLEIPFSRRQVNPLGESMLYQTRHRHPIMSGYLSRPYSSPTTDSCSPFWAFISPVDVAAQVEDITTPALASRLRDVLNFFNVGYVAVYNNYGGVDAEPLSDEQRTVINKIISQLSHRPPLSADNVVSLYEVDQAGPTGGYAFYTGRGWYKPEQVGDAPFRWMQDETSTLCVWTPRAITASLVMDGTAFSRAREVEISLGSEAGPRIYAGKLPVADFIQVQTEPLEWPPASPRCILEHVSLERRRSHSIQIQMMIGY